MPICESRSARHWMLLVTCAFITLQVVGLLFCVIQLVAHWLASEHDLVRHGAVKWLGCYCHSNFNFFFLFTKIVNLRSKGDHFFLSLYKWWNNSTHAFTTLILWGHEVIVGSTSLNLCCERKTYIHDSIRFSSEELGARIPKAFVPLQKSEGFLVFILLFFYEVQLISL